MILIIGGSGFLGYYLHHGLIASGEKIISTYYKNRIEEENFCYLNITNTKSTIKLIQKIQPDIIIYASGITDVDLCEKNKKLARAINVDGIKNVIDGAKNYGSKIIYISTSAVFDGSKRFYLETDKTNPISYYGKTKLDGEKVVINSGLPNMIIRTDQPYGWKKNWHHTNSVLRIMTTLEQGKNFEEISDWYNTPTYVEDFVKATIRLIDKEQTGFFHVVGTDYDNRFNFSKKVCDAFGFKQDKIQKINSKDLKLPAKRVNVKLVSKKIASFNITMLSFSKGLEKMKMVVS